MKSTYLYSLITMVAFSFLTLLSIISSSQALADEVATSSTGVAGSSDETRLETYIVYVRKPQGGVFDNLEDLDRLYQTFLPQAEEGSDNQRMVYSYRNAVTGFAAKLTSKEVRAMEGKDGFLSAQPEKILTIHTTRTPEFLGLNRGSGFWNLSNYGKGLVIALMDTGTTPDHPSFSPVGMPPPPAKWKGRCDFSSELCTNKIIGARNFINKKIGPLDDHGHGTHTSSIAAGRPVLGANYSGQYNGTATGVAPMAHLAIYKVCDAGGFCKESDILAGMDTAIEDGADVLSLSLGLGSLSFYDDPIAIGAFNAIQKGIFVSCSAANGGPDKSSLSNEAPWILTVGASTVDRNIRATVHLGNKQEFDGQSLYQPSNFSSTLLPLKYPGASGSRPSKFCEIGSLDNIDVKGKVVLCECDAFISSISKGRVVKAAGGAAMIVMAPQGIGNYTVADDNVLPASFVTYEDGLNIKSYINSTSKPMATVLFKGTVFGVPYAPQVADFSSRGPSIASPGILKPDVLGPGVNILAAWPSTAEESSIAGTSAATFEILSGTSMSCPHLAGVAALLKSTHPGWSPSAMKSAIMTTAYNLNLGGRPLTDQFFQSVDVFATGSGHVIPSKANDPGLVYDTEPDDYIPFLCGLNYTNKEVQIVVQSTVDCSNISRIPAAQLNYPSFSIYLGSSNQTYTRTVINVGPATSSYTSQVVLPPGVNVIVNPTKISFNEVNQKATYTVTFSRSHPGKSLFAQGYLAWTSDQHVVRSPIAVQFI